MAAYDSGIIQGLALTNTHAAEHRRYEKLSKEGRVLQKLAGMSVGLNLRA